MSKRRKIDLEAFAGPKSEDLPTDVAVLRKMLREERNKREKAEAMHMVLLGAAREVLEPLSVPPNVRPLKVKKGTRRAESQFLHLSDLQIGKVTQTYSIEQFESEMTDTFSTTVELAQIIRQDHPVDELVIALNGDLVEGEQIFPGQTWVSQVAVIHQAFRGAQILAAKIASVVPHYPRIRVYVTRGNHGRSGKDWAEVSNWDLVLGKAVEMLLEKYPSVSVEVCHDWYITYQVQGKTVVQTHGDRIRSGGDTPFTAILKRSTNWMASLPTSYDILIIGHFHNYAEFMWHKRTIFVNGSPESSNDYAASYMGMASRPLQGMFFVHPAQGVTYRTPIYLGRSLKNA